MVQLGSVPNAKMLVSCQSCMAHPSEFLDPLGSHEKSWDRHYFYSLEIRASQVALRNPSAISP